MKTQNNRFQRGTGCYTCQSCKRQTRATGGNDNEHVGLCAECYEVAGIENQISDGDGTPELLAEIARLKAIIAEKGGTLS